LNQELRINIKLLLAAMGAGAAAGLSAALSACPEDELKALCKAVPRSERDKLAEAVTAVEMATSKPAADTLALKYIFGQVDRNANGNITLDELLITIKKKPAFAKFFRQDSKIFNARVFFQDMDRNDDFNITLEEFMAFHTKSQNSVDAAVGIQAKEMGDTLALRYIFDQVDRNDSGNITMDELLITVKKKPGLADFFAKELQAVGNNHRAFFMDLDCDDDKNITFEEFVAFFAKINKLDKQKIQDTAAEHLKEEKAE